ncbi:helix-turn-helix domain-containing protein [Paenibacillus aestuarii]|uniref:Helix-turn-helix domain-containing protein n=1 Tax=Paenibacillus aestuarii TaxID=516965 RepID=A0ABW0KK57_9BACL|nr:helix-turn-helix domain-containing protein [Paenibacillus aestuarii]
MKAELGRCLLEERMAESGFNKEELARILLYKPEKLQDFIDNKRVMSLKSAVHIADALHCHAEELYEWNVPESCTRNPHN